MSKLFQYAILLHPTEKEQEEEDAQSELIVDIKAILAPSEQAAVIQASRESPEKYMDKLHRVEIAIRPF